MLSRLKQPSSAEDQDIRIAVVVVVGVLQVKPAGDSSNSGGPGPVSERAVSWVDQELNLVIQ